MENNRNPDKASPFVRKGRKATGLCDKGSIILKVLILNGELSGEQSLDRVQKLILEKLKSRGWEGKEILLNRLDIHYCTGCFGCWVQTPGVCVIPDASQQIAKSFIQSDLVILLTPVTFGGYSSELKKALDRIICLVSPFFMKVKEEVHHRPRYEQYPRLMVVGLLSKKDGEMEKILSTLVERNAINFHAPAHASKVLYDTGNGKSHCEEIQELFNKLEAN